MTQRAPSISAASPERGSRRRSELHGHKVQFYQDSTYLHRVLGDFVAAALDAQEAALVIARPDVVTALKAELGSRGHDFDEAARAGALTVLDAEESLARFVDANGELSAPHFHAIFSELLEGLRARGFAQVRAYGEMVDLLLCKGRPDAAVALEDFWNELATKFEFTLLCGYGLDRFKSAADAAAFEAICSAHSHVAPAETYSGVDQLDARLREVSSLQQRAQALESEVAQRRQMETALREALTVREEFLSIAGHELRTPLTTLGLKVHLLARDAGAQEGNPFADKVETWTRSASRQIERLTSLVNELLDVTRISRGQVNLASERVDVTAACHEVAAALESQAERAGSKVQVLADDVLLIRADRMRLEQVLSNVLENAIKYGQGKPVEIAVHQRGQMAEVSIRDQGIGVEPDHLERIFERFERATNDRAYGGIGLGLYITRTMVERMGGTVRVESVRGKGSTFTLTFPLDAS